MLTAYDPGRRTLIAAAFLILVATAAGAFGTHALKPTLSEARFDSYQIAVSYQFFHALMLVQEYGVWNKLLFGTDYPFTTVDATIAGLRSLNQMVAGTGLPRLNTDALETLIFRDPLPLLNLK